MTRALLALLFLAVPTIADDDRAWRERLRWLPIGAHYGMSYHGTVFSVALFMKENGPDHNPYGHDNHNTNREGDACPFVPKADRRIASAHIAMLRALQEFVLSHPGRRKEFTDYFARFYHAGGGATNPANQDANNAAYARELREVWRTRAVPWMKAHGMDQMWKREQHPIQVNGDLTGSVWVP